MSAGPSLFRETDVKRAFEAAKLAGIDVARVEIGKDGTISIIPAKGATDAKPAPLKPPAGGMLQPEPWD